MWKMIVEIDDEVADEIVRGALMNTYLNLSRDLKNNKKLDDEDKVMYQNVVAAIEVLGTWFFYDFAGKVKEAKAKRKKNETI
jgi:hypothetical protein